VYCIVTIAAVTTVGGSYLPVREESSGEAAQASAKGGSDGAAAARSRDARPPQASAHPASPASARGE